jgi:hypothetical protein
MWQDLLGKKPKLDKITETAFKAIDANNNEKIELNELE